MIDEKEYNKVEFDENKKPIIKLVNRQKMLDNDKIVMDSLDLWDVQELAALVDYDTKTGEFDNVYSVIDNYDFTHAINEKTYFVISSLILINNEKQSPTSDFYINHNKINWYGDRLTSFTSFVKKP